MPAAVEGGVEMGEGDCSSTMGKGGITKKERGEGWGEGESEIIWGPG